MLHIFPIFANFETRKKKGYMVYYWYVYCSLNWKMLFGITNIILVKLIFTHLLVRKISSYMYAWSNSINPSFIIVVPIILSLHKLLSNMYESYFVYFLSQTYTCTVIPEEELETFKNSLTIVHSIHVYSVQKASLKVIVVMYIFIITVYLCKYFYFKAMFQYCF